MKKVTASSGTQFEIDESDEVYDMNEYDNMEKFTEDGSDLCMRSGTLFQRHPDGVVSVYKCLEPGCKKYE